MSKQRKEGAREREAVLARDGGICANCRLDTVWLKEAIHPTAPFPINYQYTMREPVDIYPCELSPPDWHHQWSLNAEARAIRFANDCRVFRYKLEDRSRWLTAYPWAANLGKGDAFWQADHILAVEENGGGCGIDGLQTLCLNCHQKKTAEHAARRAKRPSKTYNNFHKE